ncbi:GAF domain-containing protein [Altericroceibacterium endophyticum]|uniref:GAF domain-containing protein n=1 Tax=Altericroceibacterium endophyticum TaxID=1808508 RepID=A0A6I4T729_9SPHN|nr:GAF domain-containing protein [Altericroceibacterium endophyticum]MXO65660.1 GAF domain-containing protein [Altericroceibacterium endophyticum]
MYDFAIDPTRPKTELYGELHSAAQALTDGEPDSVANMANVAALIWQFLPDLNWAGFYRMVEGELVLGPFCGKPACIRIPIGRGVCGKAVETGVSQRVDDVHAFPGHIACDADSRSELVVPLLNDGACIGVIDLDSPVPSRFTAEDETGIEKLAALLAPKLAA